MSLFRSWKSKERPTTEGTSEEEQQLRVRMLGCSTWSHTYYAQAKFCLLHLHFLHLQSEADTAHAVLRVGIVVQKPFCMSLRRLCFCTLSIHALSAFWS